MILLILRGWWGPRLRPPVVVEPLVVLILLVSSTFGFEGPKVSYCRQLLASKAQKCCTVVNVWLLFFKNIVFYSTLGVLQPPCTPPRGVFPCNILEIRNILFVFQEW